MALRLIHLPNSPWSERVHFALKVAALPEPVAKVAYTPVTDELWLRFVTGRWNPFTRVSVPVLCVGNQAISESIDIARWLSAQPGSQLRMGDDEAVLQTVQILAERLQAAGRHACMSRVIALGPAKADVSPVPWVLKALMPEFILRAMCVVVYHVIVWKYRRPEFTSTAAADAIVRAGLLELRALRGSKAFFNGDSLTYTDIIAAVAVSALTFPAHKDATGFTAWEDVWSSPALVGEFKDLIAWRDDVYARFR